MLLGAGLPAAQNSGSIAGAVVDPLGARVSGAIVNCCSARSLPSRSRRMPSGDFAFDALSAGRYRIEVDLARDSRLATTDPLYVAGHRPRQRSMSACAIGPLRAGRRRLTAAATTIPVSQIGAQVTVLDAATLDALGKPDVLEAAAARCPARRWSQAGGRGAVTSLFVRGGSVQLQQGADRRRRGQRHRRRLRLLVAVAVTGVDSRRSAARVEQRDLRSGRADGRRQHRRRNAGARATPEFTYAIDGGNLGHS